MPRRLPLCSRPLPGSSAALSEAGIPTVLLVGNHDQHAQGTGGASLSIYRTLGVPDVIVGDSLTTHRITTRNGMVQVVTLPWLNHSTLLTRPETEGLTMAQVGDLLLDRLRVALEGEIPPFESQLAGRCYWPMPWSIPPATGLNAFLAAGRGFTIPMAMVGPSLF